MLFKEEQQNCSLIFFPESHKGKTGFLLGINLTEFIVVVLDIVEVMSHEKSISELKSYVDLPAFKFIVRRFVHSEIKVLGAVINPENPDSNSETVQRLSQFDVWLNLEYKPSEDKLVFRDLILCGYRYNTTSSIIYYDTEASGFLTTDGKLLVKAMAQPDQEFSIESDHFDINVYQAYKCLQSDGGHLLPMNQSRDVFESVCKVINYRRLLLSIWHSVFNRSELLALDNVADDQSVGSNSFDLEKELVFGDGMVENVQARNRGSSSVFKAKGKIFNFEMEDMSSMDTFSAKRPKKFSEELLDDIEALNTPNIYKKQSAQSTVQKMADNKSIQSLNRIPENSLRELDPVKGRMIKKEPEWKFIFKILTALVQFMSVGYGAAFKLLNLVPYLDRILNTTYCHLLFRTKLALKMAVKLDKLVKQQPAKNSVLLKDVSFFVNTLSLTAFDLMIGWALFTLFFFYSQEIAGSIRDAQMLIHPDVFKRQLAMILDNPAGIKLNQTYCGIISKLTQTIFILQDATLHYIVKYLSLILWLIAFSSLTGVTVALSIICDMANCVIFHVKMTFGFINMIFSEHASWFKILWRVSSGTRFNYQESITLDLVQTIVCHFPMGSIMTGRLLSRISPKLMHIKHISNISEFRLQRKDIDNSWQYRKFVSELKTMKGLKALTSALLSKPGSMLELIFPSKKDLNSIDTEAVIDCGILEAFKRVTTVTSHCTVIFG